MHLGTHFLRLCLCYGTPCHWQFYHCQHVVLSIRLRSFFSVINYILFCNLSFLYLLFIFWCPCKCIYLCMFYVGEHLVQAVYSLLCNPSLVKLIIKNKLQNIKLHDNYFWRRLILTMLVSCEFL